MVESKLYITPEEFAAFRAAKKFGHDFDNAAQTVLFPNVAGTSFKEAERILSEAFQLKDKAPAAMKQFFPYHSRAYGALGEVGDVRKLPAKRNIHLFYSLIYHLLDQNGQWEKERTAIKETFEIFHMGLPLPQEEILNHMNEIMTFTQRSGRARG